ncbi:hypothetical protein BKA80DRAFT_253347 [Phyllosticta citrichinensis]
MSSPIRRTTPAVGAVALALARAAVAAAPAPLPSLPSLTTLPLAAEDPPNNCRCCCDDDTDTDSNSKDCDGGGGDGDSDAAAASRKTLDRVAPAAAAPRKGAQQLRFDVWAAGYPAFGRAGAQLQFLVRAGVETRREVAGGLTGWLAMWLALNIIITNPTRPARPSPTAMWHAGMMSVLKAAGWPRRLPCGSPSGPAVNRVILVLPADTRLVYMMNCVVNSSK